MSKIKSIKNITETAEGQSILKKQQQQTNINKKENDSQLKSSDMQNGKKQHASYQDHYPEKKIFVKHDMFTINKNKKTETHTDPDKVDLETFVTLLLQDCTAGLCCWNCTEEYKLLKSNLTELPPPVFICDFINDDLQTYSISGYFCSMGCCACFLQLKSSYSTPVLLMNTLLFHNKLLGGWFKDHPNKTNLIQSIRNRDVSKPSPFLSLKKFGGPLSIEDYRGYQK